MGLSLINNRVIGVAPWRAGNPHIDQHVQRFFLETPSILGYPHGHGNFEMFFCDRGLLWGRAQIPHPRNSSSMPHSTPVPSGPVKGESQKSQQSPRTWRWIPSGKHRKNYGRSPCVMGKSTTNGNFSYVFSIAMLDCQRVLGFAYRTPTNWHV